VIENRCKRVIFDAFAHDATTEEQRIDFVSGAFVQPDADADKAIVAELVANVGDEYITALLFAQSDDLVFRIAIDGRVELIGSLDQFGHAIDFVRFHLLHVDIEFTLPEKIISCRCRGGLDLPAPVFLDVEFCSALALAGDEFGLKFG